MELRDTYYFGPAVTKRGNSHAVSQNYDSSPAQDDLLNEKLVGA